MSTDMKRISSAPLSHSAGQLRIDDQELNPAQLAAVLHDEGPLLVVAGAGTGKTRTLTYRVARLVQDGIPPEAILLLSFTRKAAEEMLKRAAQLLDARCQRVSGGTFHSFAFRTLRQHASKIGFQKGFSIMDRPDTEQCLELLGKTHIPASHRRHMPRAASLATLYSRAVNKEQSLQDIIYEDCPQYGEQVARIVQLQTLYQQHKREYAVCDYDDLLVYLRQLLARHRPVREKLRAQYRYLLVDEYQDTNLIQADIVCLLAGEQRNVMVVGDDAQSIYAFRGAHFQNITSFADRFPAARIITLEENYRSSQPILDLSNAIIANAICPFVRLGFPPA